MLSSSAQFFPATSWATSTAPSSWPWSSLFTVPSSSTSVSVPLACCKVQATLVTAPVASNSPYIARAAAGSVK